MSASVSSRLLDILGDMGRLARTMDLESCEHTDAMESLVFRLEAIFLEALVFRLEALTIDLERATSAAPEEETI